MKLQLFNTLTRQKEIFTPIDEKMVRIYSCGPTVYGAPHIGNMRKYFMDDLLKNVIKHLLGLPTTHVVNITDVGHLTGENEGDADHGEDKMEKGARREGLTAWDVAKKYEEVFHKDCATLRIDKFDIMPRATDHISEQIAMIEELEKKGFTYVIDSDGVYMDTVKVPHYDVLVGHKHIEGIMSGARVEDTGKRNPTDFALWKFNITGKKRDMEWESPWGVGFPGWHIECSAMSIKYLGKHFDIHTGGIDHIPVHHTNEIAQSQCSIAETPWVNYWMHYQFLNILGKKVSKSLGNTFTIEDVVARGFTPEDLRYFYLQAHYKSFQDFTWDALEAAKTARYNLKKKLLPYIHVAASEEYKDDVSYLTDVLVDDLDTPKLLARLWASLDALDENLASGIRWFDENILKLDLFTEDHADIIEIPASILELAAQRWKAKQAKDYAKADELRADLAAAGWEMRESKDDYIVGPLKH